MMPSSIPCVPAKGYCGPPGAEPGEPLHQARSTALATHDRRLVRGSWAVPLAPDRRYAAEPEALWRRFPPSGADKMRADRALAVVSLTPFWT
jgi:hypothetical protein